MGWQDRQYASESNYPGAGRPMFHGSGMRTWDVVTKLIIANILFYLLTTSRMGAGIAELCVMQASSVWRGEIWRLLTATYMHANFMHIVFNMMVLYFLGPIVEHRLGAKQFFIVYTIGGVLGNILITLAAIPGFVDPNVLGLGASGSVWTVMAAAAMYFPNAEVLIYFVLPVRLRTVVIVYFIWFVYNVTQQGVNYGGDICHLAGLLFGLYWAKTGGWAWAGGTAAHSIGVSRPGIFKSFFGRAGKSATGGPTARERVRQRQDDAQTIDRLLQKVYDKGIHSLSDGERKELNEATERMRVAESRADKAGRT
jgi:membrane associated rhomboid family serine protease